VTIGLTLAERPVLGLLLDDDAVETGPLSLEFFVSGRHPVGPEHVGDDVDVLVVAQKARIVFRHRRPSVFEQSGKRFSIPVAEELRPCQRGR